MDGVPFALLLREFQARWPAQRPMARRAGIDHARYNRLIRGEVEPAGRDQVLDIARALELSARETDVLVAAAGFLPPSLSPRLLGNAAVHSLLRALDHPAIPDDDRAELASHVDQAVRWFLAARGIPDEPAPSTFFRQPRSV